MSINVWTASRPLCTRAFRDSIYVVVLTFWKWCGRQNEWKWSPKRGENKTCLKPLPSYTCSLCFFFCWKCPCFLCGFCMVSKTWLLPKPSPHANRNSRTSKKKWTWCVPMVQDWFVFALLDSAKPKQPSEVPKMFKSWNPKSGSC